MKRMLAEGRSALRNVANRLAVVTLVVLVLLGISSVAAQAQSASEFAGTYRNEKLTVVIAVDADVCNGIIVMADGQKRLPLSGRVEAGKLAGTFVSDGNKFEFSASLSGGELTLDTGGTTYVLKNANPLAHGAAATAPAHPPVKEGNIAGKWAIDGDLGGEKFTLKLGLKGDIEVESDSGNSASGPTYAYADGVLTFDGGTTINKLSLAGKWKIAWKDQDTFTTADDQGKPLTLHRLK